MSLLFVYHTESDLVRIWVKIKGSDVRRSHFILKIHVSKLLW